MAERAAEVPDANAQDGVAPTPSLSIERSVLRFILSGRYWALARLAATSFVGGLTEALFLVLVTRAAFAITDGRDRIGVVAAWYVSVGQALALGAVLVLIRFVLGTWAGHQSARLTSDIVAELRRRLAQAFLGASWEVQQLQRAGSFQELLGGFSNQASQLVAALGQGIVAAANLVALLTTAVVVDPLGAVVLVVSVIALSLVVLPLRRAVNRRARVARRASLDLAAAGAEMSRMGLELHVFRVQRAAGERLDGLVEHVRRLAFGLAFLRAVTSPVYAGLAYLAVLGVLALVAAGSTTTLTSLGAAMLVMLRSLSYGQALQAAFTAVGSSTPSVETVQERIRTFERSVGPSGGRPVGAVGTLATNAVTFGYADEGPVLQDVSFELAVGEVIGIVGPSGSGKSTLVQLLLGLRDPQQGTITAEGRDISTLDRDEWARRVTFVPQASHLVAGSIADNIRFLRRDISDEQVEQAARLAHLHEEIVAFPGGYGRQVGEHGGHLSGGQQQRLCLARALVEAPDVLILDEPTSALDVHSEHLVRSTLLQLKARMTVIVIAHRLSTLDICDRIMVIQDGRIRAFDSPKRLEQSSSFYREALLLSGMR